MSPYEGFIVSDGIAELIVLHEEDVSDVKFPGFMFTAKFSTLTENFFNHVIVALIPVDFSLHHEHWDILVKSLIVF